MSGKFILFVVLLAAAGIVPYVVSEERWVEKLENIWGRVADASDSSEQSTREGDEEDGSESEPTPALAWQTLNTSFHTAVAAPSTATTQPHVDIPLPHVLNFRATPEWIRSTWDRVTSRVGEPELYGWRVPYYRSSDDFAGSVTYYFDEAKRVQRILLHGYTSDPRELVQIATSYYQMTRLNTTEGDLYVATIGGQRIGALQVTYAPLLNGRHHEKECEVTLEINRQGSSYGMSREFRDRIQDTQRLNELVTPLSPSPFE